MDMFDMLDMFDIDELEKEEEKSKEKKKEKKADKKSENKSESKSAIVVKKYKLPVTIHTDYYSPITIQADDVVTEMTEEEIKTYLGSKYAFLKKFQLEVLGEDKFLAVKPSTGSLNKGTEKVTDELSVVMGENIIDISSLTEGVEEVSYEKISNFIKKQCGCDIELHKDAENGQLNVFFGDKSSAKATDLKFPFTMIMGMANVTNITKAMYLDATNATEKVTVSAQQALLDDEDAVEENEEKDEAEISLDGLYKVAENLNELYKGGHAMLLITENNVVRVLYKRKFSTPVSQPKTETLYPTDVEISLGYESYKLSAELFDGKKEVSEKEIIKYLQKQRREYDPSRTELIYDKKLKIIIPLLKSSKRGIGIAEEGIKYCVRDNAMAYMKLPIDSKKHLDKGEFYFKIGKIPSSIFTECFNFFKNVYDTFHTEAIVYIMYNSREKAFFSYVPEQNVSSSSVEDHCDYALQSDPGIWTVGTIHSHGAYGAFFSSVDDAYETGFGIYGVIGKLDTDSPEMLFRIGTDGVFKKVSYQDIFTQGGEALDLWTDANISAIHAMRC